MKSERVPMRWPSEWRDPARLALIRDTPINCLVGSAPPPFPLGDIEFLQLDPEDAPEGVVLREGRWPGVQAARENPDTVEAGPTGAPWVESNASLIRLTQALHPGKEVWLTYPPPSRTEVIPFDRFPLPVAEAEAYNARWIIDLHASLRAGLENSTPQALAAWRKIVAFQMLSRRHGEWRDWKAVAALAVISDFEGDNEFLAREFLNLAPRRNLACRIVLKSKAASTSLSGLRAVLLTDRQPPAGDLARHLSDFVRNGGLLILAARPSFAPSEPDAVKFDYDLYKLGAGRIAVPREEWYDPYVLAAQAHLLLSHRHDVVRIWNGGSMNAHYVASADGASALVHLIEYGRARNLRSDVTLGFATPYRTAKVTTLEGETAVQPVKSRLGVEIPLPPFALYTAIELGV